jgi:putative flippase GtrA
VGILNTLVGLLVVAVLHQGFHINIVASNAAGYVVGGINSFWFNRNWTFNSTQYPATQQVTRFIMVFGLCYLVNLLVLRVSLHFLKQWPLVATIHGQWGIQPGMMAHGIANVVYVLLGFTLFRKFVFPADSSSH